MVDYNLFVVSCQTRFIHGLNPVALSRKTGRIPHLIELVDFGIDQAIHEWIV